MRVVKSRVVNLFITLGCPKAMKWNNDVLTGRVGTLHELFDLDMEIDEKYRGLFTKIYNAAKNNLTIDIVDDSDSPVEALIKNVSAVVKMKPVEEVPEGQSIKPPKSKSEVTIVPDPDTQDFVDDEEDEAALVEKESVVKEPETELEPVVENAESVTEDERAEQETLNVPEKIEVTDAVKVESKQEPDTKETKNVLVYKSKLGKPSQVRRPLFNFELLDIPIGAKLYFVKDPSKSVTVCSKKTVLFEELFGDAPVSLTHLTKVLCNLPRDVQPTGYWMYEGVTLKKLYYAKFSDTQSIDVPKKPKTVQHKPRTVFEPICLTVFHWDMDTNMMNPVEQCLVSDSLDIEGISKKTSLSMQKVKQLLTPLVRYGVVLQNDNGTFIRSDHLTKVE
jgi:hypothetical protein